ncbi:MAG: Crp/Fnr family transcriptional regulator [Planctomycetota bacterium]|jgi:CRP-like cAMP-binding protein
MAENGLGATYQDGEVIVRQGDVADRMFVIQKGRAQILLEQDGRETPIRVAGEGELIGEMAIFERDVRSATVRALGEVRVLTVDRKNFLRRIHEDPSLAFRVVQTMSRRVRELSDDLACLKGKGSQV